MLDMDGVDKDRDSVDFKFGFYCILSCSIVAVST